MTIYKNRNKEQIFLGEKIGFGGEADVYYLKNNKSLVAKIYNDAHPIDAKKHKKLKKMCDLYDDTIAKYYTWPKDIIYSNNKPIGIIMDNLNNTNSKSKYIKLINFYHFDSRKENFPNAEYKYMVHAALNFACAVETLHKKGIVIGDINESNIFVNDTDATIKIIDCDSYQIEDFSSDVGKPEYTAPELPNNLRGVLRTQNHDCFALAIIIFLILVGRHPYSGIGTPQGFREAIVQNLYCYGKNAENKGVSSIRPYSEIFNLLNKNIKELFERAFNTQMRPNTNEWISALKNYENQLVDCDYGDNHWYNPEYKSCLWCDLEESGLFFFGTTQVNAQPIQHSYTNTQNQPTYNQNQAGRNYQQQYRAGANQTNINSFDFIKFLKDMLKGIFYSFVGIFAFAITLFIQACGGFKKLPKIISSILILGFLILGSYIKNFNKKPDPQNPYIQREIQEQQVKKEAEKIADTPKNTTQNIPKYTPEEQKELNLAFNSYMKYVTRIIKSNWNPPINNEQYSVVVAFKIAKDGRLISSKIKKSSGNQAIDNSALDTIKYMAPFKPLPTILKEDSVDVEFTLENVRKY